MKSTGESLRPSNPALPEGTLPWLEVSLASLHGLPPGDLALLVYEDERPLPGVAGLIDWRLNGALSTLLRSERFRGQSGELLLTVGYPWQPPRRIFLQGLGPSARHATGAACQLGQLLWVTLERAGAHDVLVAFPASRQRPDHGQAIMDELPPPPLGLKVSYLRLACSVLGPEWQ